MKPQAGVGISRKKMLRTVLYHQGGSSFTEGSPMDTLQACAKAFENLLPIKYHILIGRKGKSVVLTVSFEAVEFHHLVGLHKLHDLRLSRANREKSLFPNPLR